MPVPLFVGVAYLNLEQHRGRLRDSWSQNDYDQTKEEIAFQAHLLLHNDAQAWIAASIATAQMNVRKMASAVFM
jgi:hypothetical protein